MKKRPLHKHACLSGKSQDSTNQPMEPMVDKYLSGMIVDLSHFHMYQCVLYASRYPTHAYTSHKCRFIHFDLVLFQDEGLFTCSVFEGVEATGLNGVRKTCGRSWGSSGPEPPFYTPLLLPSSFALLWMEYVCSVVIVWAAFPYFWVRP